VERDFRSLPEKRQTPLTRKLLASAPHNRGCMTSVMGDMMQEMLQGREI
jgi:hypothetical protein